MNDVRDKIAALVADAKGIPTPTMREWEKARDTATDRIIALVRDALLSAEAVEALLESAEEDSVLVMALSARKQRGDKVTNEAGRSMGREWIQAQLAAAGFAEKEQ